jgi:hypothetical protein
MAARQGSKMRVMLPRFAHRWLIALGFALAAAPFIAAQTRAEEPKKSAPPASQPSDEGAADWNEVGFTEDTLHEAFQQRVYQFKIGSPKWRITAETENPSGSNNSHIRIAIEVETIRDFRHGTPANWGPFEHLYDGKPGGSGTKELANGVNKDGSFKYFRLVISGVNVHYHIVIEDQSPGDAKPKHKKKRK